MELWVYFGGNIWQILRYLLYFIKKTIFFQSAGISVCLIDLNRIQNKDKWYKTCNLLINDIQ